VGKKRVVTKTGTGSEESVLLKKGLPKIRKDLKRARLYIFSSYNNTIISLGDEQGNILFSSSAGKVGFQGTKKGTAYAASKVAEAVALATQNSGIEEYEVYVKGIGPGRDSALRTLAAKNLNIVLIKDVTPIPHNGPTPPKVRRV
jgi:small subunit ribosomal protein S11